MKQPVAFVAHGAPTLALDAEKGAELTKWAASMSRPRAVLIVSAHWEADQVLLGATTPAPLIYDFSGFPEPLYRIQYQPPGAAELADRVSALLQPEWPVRRTDRGLDHGAWVPLLHLFPQADVPVLQMALPSQHSNRMLLELGRRLAPLRDESVLVLASGVLVHNFSFIRFGGGPVEPWAIEFEAWVAEKLQAWDLDALVNARTIAPGGRHAIPTPEHFQPLYIALGAADPHPQLEFPIRGFEMGSLSRTCVQFT
ncbi:MAG: dioxygenase family protein [Candidatus Xenobia bacterium]